MRVREDGTEGKDPNLIKLADILFEGQELYILYLAQTMLQPVSYFPINTCIFSTSSQVAGAKEICGLGALHLFPMSQCHYCFHGNDWHCLKK